MSLPTTGIAFSSLTKLTFAQANNTVHQIVLGGSTTGTADAVIAMPTFLAGLLLAANNLSDLANAGTARTNLGLGTAATLNTGTSSGNIPLLGASGMPAVAASLLTSLNGSNISSGTVAAARLAAMVASGTSHAPGIVPDTPSSSGTTKFLREDATWAVPSGGGSSPLTTKGDIYTFSTVDARLPVGTDGYFLVADSGQATGLNWVASTPGGSSGAAGVVQISDGSGGFSSNGRISIDVIGNELLIGNGIGSAALVIQNFAQLNVSAGAAGNFYSDGTTVPLIVAAAATQTGHLLNISANNGTVMAYFDATGNIVAPNLGSAAGGTLGVSANNVVQLNGSAQLPGVDGSLLIGIASGVSGLVQLSNGSGQNTSDSALSYAGGVLNTQNGFSASNTAGFSGTVSPVTSITVIGGIITAAS